MQAARKNLKSVRAKKSKIDFPIFSKVENILKEYNISAALYHGGKLNMVDCHELIRLAKPIFLQLETELLSVTHEDRCSKEKIIDACHLHCDICVMLDLAASKLRLKNGEPCQQDYQALEKCIEKLHELWALAQLNYTPKMHSILNHGLEHMRRYNGIGDTREDDVKRMHQMSARIEARTSRMKNKGQQSFVHSKIEVVQNCAMVQKKNLESQAASRRVMKKRNPEACTITRAKRAKAERDQGRAETLTSLDRHMHQQIRTSHEEKRDEQLHE